MKQIEIRTIPGGLGLSELAIHGATLLGAGLPLTRNTAAAITGDRNALDTTENAYELAKTTLSTDIGLRDTAMDTARSFAVLTRDVLKPHLGNSHSPAWTAAGFKTSLTVPRQPLAVVYIVNKLTDYLTQNPSMENLGLNITAAQAGIVGGGLLSAENAVITKRVATADAKIVRDAKFVLMRKRIRDLVKELSQILTPLDTRWEQFGLNRPGAQTTPAIPDKVSVTVTGNGAISVKWKSAARAQYYRVWKKVIGVDEDFIAAGSPADLDFTLENLPVGSSVEIMVSAVNSGGESQKSEKVTILVTA